MRCRGNPVTRRGFLTAGVVGSLGLSLADYLFLQHASAAVQQGRQLDAKASSVIHIFLPGGVAQQESFDPKPYAPIEYRGDFGVIKTKTGDVFCDTLPKLAGISDKFSVIRSMTHSEAAHERGTHNMFTGYRPSPAVAYPSMGSVVSHEYGPRNHLPPYVCIPDEPNEYAGTGYLRSAHAAFSLGADPARKDFRVRDLNLPRGVDEPRFGRRQDLLDRVNQRFADQSPADSVQAMNTFYQRAYDLINSPQAREAFDINQEPDALRDQYGRNQAGQRMLMARRLVEAGVRFATLTYGSWDMHARLADGMRRWMPEFDQALTALINDLDQRGLLDSTLVMVSSEFGRTPKVNKDAGRDHWPKVFSVLLAGGGVRRGMIYGASDATAAEPDRDPVSPADLATTVYQQLGIDAQRELMAPGDRPIEIVKGGKLLQPLVS